MEKLQSVFLAMLLAILVSCSKEEPAKKEVAKQPQKPVTLKDTIDYLTSDELGGRLYNSEGSQKAAQYVADKFQELGLKPAGEKGTYFQKFKDGTNWLS